jgi:hypothetical protein
MWERPVEIIHGAARIREVRGVLASRPDAQEPVVVALLAECGRYLPGRFGSCPATHRDSHRFRATAKASSRSSAATTPANGAL